MRFACIGALGLVLTGCASVQLGDASAPSAHLDQGAGTVERAELAMALQRLENRPWNASVDPNEGIVTLLFGGSGPTTKALAEDYLVSLNADGPDAARLIRSDLEETLTAAWQVAHTGKAAVRANSPAASDLKTVEAAIMETRQCRLVYAEALTMLSKDNGSVERDEIRRVKEQFTQAILELGRTADALSTRLKAERAATFATADASAAE